MSFAVRLQFVDPDGKVLYETSMDGASGRAISVVVASNIRTAMKPIQGDIYAVVDPNNRIVLPSLELIGLSDRVALSWERVIPTLEVIEVSSGRVIDFANNPRVLVPDGPE